MSPHQILLDAGARGHLAYRISTENRPPLINEGAWRDMRLGRRASIDIGTLAILCDMIPNLLEDLRAASREEAEWQRCYDERCALDASHGREGRP